MRASRDDVYPGGSLWGLTAAVANTEILLVSIKVLLSMAGREPAARNNTTGNEERSSPLRSLPCRSNDRCFACKEGVTGRFQPNILESFSMFVSHRSILFQPVIHGIRFELSFTVTHVLNRIESRK